MRGIRGRTLVLTGVVAIAAAAGVGYAAIPAADGTITGCFRMKGDDDESAKGTLRVVDSAGECKKNEQALTWNQRGPTGAPGAVGAPGPAGAKGETGATGPAGAVGAVGPAGLAGATGDRGPAGVAGAKGDKGEPGAQGIQGDGGAQGLQGLMGVTGPKGDTGPSGVKGDTGATGPAGQQGPAGTGGAYARVVWLIFGGPVFVSSQTSNFTTVTLSGTGVYCLELSPASGIVSGTRPAVVSVDTFNTTPPVGNTSAQFGGGCGVNGIGVRTYRRPAGSMADSALANDIAFTVIVP